MQFEKWQGLGNDFIVTEAPVTPQQARELCDRRRGVGADGVLVVERDGPRMTVLNADGSRPEMCGNGLRCVAGWLAERGRVGELTVQTDAGPRVCTIERAGDGRYDVRADMGRAQVTGEMSYGDPARRFLLVDVGNPHAVCFERLELGEAERVGPSLESHVQGGINVELVTARPSGGFDVRVFERGVGWTDACGTGACAVVVAAVREGLAAPDDLVPVHLPGGPLVIQVTRDAVFMRGPAGRVFVGEVDL